MKKIQPDERDFQSFVKKHYHGFISQLHPGLSCDVGIPDLLCLVYQGLLPVELKIGTISENTLWCSDVRPAQISWHGRLANAGGTSLFLVGVWFGDKWRAFLVDGLAIGEWDRTGFEIGKTAIEINPQNLKAELERYFDQL